ncbi:MAG: FHA domain-containing protein [Thermoflexales bacterium]|nr:FHA domain-containing protein [Thermoflexales bacterium]
MIAGEVLLLALRILLAMLLYTFLAALFFLLWRDLRRSAGRETIPREEMRLVVVKAGERGPEPGTVFPLQEVNSLGRAPSSTIRLSDPFVSSHHALITWREGRWWLEDLGSKNGTTLNDEPVTRPTVVDSGDLIGIGKVVFRIEAGE